MKSKIMSVLPLMAIILFSLVLENEGFTPGSRMYNGRKRESLSDLSDCQQVSHTEHRLCFSLRDYQTVLKYSESFELLVLRVRSIEPILE